MEGSLVLLTNVNFTVEKVDNVFFCLSNKLFHELTRLI